MFSKSSLMAIIIFCLYFLVLPSAIQAEEFSSTSHEIVQAMTGYSKTRGFCPTRTFKRKKIDKGQVVTESVARDKIKLAVIDMDREKALLVLDQPVGQEPDTQADEIKIFTGKGEADQTYLEGENLRLFVQTAKPLYVHIYNFNPRGETSLIYQFTEDKIQPFSPNKVLVIPDPDSEEVIETSYPCGLESFKIFASDKPLPLPLIDDSRPSLTFVNGKRTFIRQKKTESSLAKSQKINSLDLGGWYRETAGQSRAKLREAALIVQTRAKAR